MPSEPYGSNASGSSSSMKERPSNVAQPRTLEPLETPTLDKGKERAGSRYWSDLQSGKASPPPPLLSKQFSKPPSTRPTSLQSQNPVSSSSSINSFPPPPPPPPASSSLKRPNPFARDSPVPRPPPPPPSSSAWLPANPVPIPTSSPLHQYLDSLVTSSPSSPSTIELARTLRKWARGVDTAPLTYFDDPSQHWARKLSRRDLRKVLQLGGSAGGVGLGKAAKEELLARALKQERGATTRTEEKEKRKMMHLVWKQLEKGDRISTRLNGGEVWEVLYEMVPEGFPFLEKTQGNKFVLKSLDTSEERTVEEWFGFSPSQSSASRSSSILSNSSRSRTSDVASVPSHKKRRVRRRESSSPPADTPSLHHSPPDGPRTKARPSLSSSSSSSRLPQDPPPVASSSASSSSRPSSSSKVPQTPKRSLQTESTRTASRNTRVVEEEVEDDQDLANENSRAPWPSQRTDVSFGLESNISSSLARAADAAEEAFSKSSVKIDRSHRYPFGQPAHVSVEPSEEEQLNDPQPEDEDSDCIYYEPAPEPDDEEAMNSLDDAVGEDEFPEEEDGIEHEVEQRALKDGEIEDELEEGEIDDDDGEEAQLNDGLASPPEVEIIAGPIKRGRGRHFAPDVPPEVEVSNAPVPEEEDDDDDEPIFLEIRPSPSKSSASAASQVHQPPIIVASPPEDEEEEEEEEPSQQSQRIDASQEASSTQSSVGPEPPAFEGPADLTWAEDGGEPATVPATVRITRGDDSKHRLECQVLATGDAFSSSEEELRSAVVDEARRTITWTRSMFADQVSLSFRRPTPSLTNLDSTWDPFVKVYKSLFVGGSSQSKGKEREVIVLDDDEEENEVEVVEEVEEVAKESVDEAMVLNAPWIESERRSLLVNLSSFDLTSPERGNDFPRPSRCTIRVSVVQTTYGVGESIVEQRIHSSRLRHGPGALATLEIPIAFEVDEAAFNILDPSLPSFSGQLGLLPMSTLRLRVEYLSFNDSDGRPSKWILKALSSSRKDPAGSVRLPEAYFEISRPENLFGRWLEQQHPFQPAQQHDGVYLKGWDVGLTFRWNESRKDSPASDDGMGLEDDVEIEIDEPVVKRSTIPTVSESPSRREETAVEEAIGSFDEDVVVTEEDQSRKRKTRDLDELLERPSSVRRLSAQPLQESISFPQPSPQPSLPPTSTSTNLVADPNPLSDPVVPPPRLDDSTSPSPVKESTSLAQEPLGYQYDEIPSDDEIELDEPAGQQDLPMQDSTRLASPPLAPAVVIQPPSSLVAPPSQEKADDEHLSEKGPEASSPSSRERSVSVRGSSLLTDSPVDERMDDLAQEHRSHRASSSRLPSSSLSAELFPDAGNCDPPLPSTSSSTITPLPPLAPSSSSSLRGPVPHPPQENALAGPSNWRKPSAAAAMIDRAKAKRNPFVQPPPPPPSQGPKPKQQVYIISSDEDDDDDPDEPFQPAPPSKRPSQSFNPSTTPQSTPQARTRKAEPSHSQPVRFWETNPPLPPPKPQAPPSETPRLASSVFKPPPATSEAFEQSNREPQPPSSSSSTPKLKPAQSSRSPSSLQIPIPHVHTPNHLTAIHLKTFLSNSSAGTSAPSLLRGNSTSSASSSSNPVPDASTSSQALFEALTDAQKKHALKTNPQKVEGTTFPRVVSKRRTKATSQRVVGGVFADLLWRLEKISGDESYRMRERDEAIFDIEGLQNGQKVLMCCWNRWVEKNSLDRIHQKNAPSYTIGFVNKYFRVLDDLHLYPFFVVLLTTLRTFELIDTKVIAAALAKWSSLRRERVAKKLEEKTNGGGSKPKGVEGRKVVTVVRIRGDRG